MTRWLMVLLVWSCGRTDLPDEFVVETRGVDAGRQGAPSDAGTRQALTVFAASLDAGTWELFSTGGTGPSTQRLGPITARSSGIPPVGLSFERRHYFPCELPSLGAELCVTDGTPEGTGLFLDLVPGPSSSGAFSFVVGGGRLVFLTAPNTLWESDGTPDGTVVALNSTGSIRVLDGDETGVTVWANGELLRVRRGVRTVLGGHREPVSTGATLDSTFYFVGFDAEHGRELWRTTTAGVERVDDISPGPSSSLSTFPFVVSGGRLYFQAHQANQTWLFSLAPGQRPQRLARAAWGMPMTAFENDCVFFFEGTLSRASASGVRRVAAIENVYAPVVVADRLYFQARIGGVFGVWRLEGDVPQRLQTFSEQPFGLAESGGSLYLRGATANAGSEVWVINDGVPTLLDVNPGAGSSLPSNFQPLPR